MTLYIRLFLSVFMPLKRSTIIQCRAACWSPAACRSVFCAGRDFRWKLLTFALAQLTPAPHLCYCMVKALSACVVSHKLDPWTAFNPSPSLPYLPPHEKCVKHHRHPSCVYTLLTCAKNKPLLVAECVIVFVFVCVYVCGWVVGVKWLLEK